MRSTIINNAAAFTDQVIRECLDGIASSRCDATRGLLRHTLRACIARYVRILERA